MNEIDILTAINLEIQNPLHWTKDEQNKAIELAVSLLKEQWIPVSKALPLIPQREYYVTISDGLSRWCCVSNFNGNNFKCEDKQYKVIAWKFQNPYISS